MPINIKPKKCTECGRDNMPWFSKKRCKSCAQKSYKKPKQVSEKKKIAKEKQSNRRNKYFDYHIERCTHCEESGEVIPYPSRMNICHILPKSNHPSVGDNLDNFVYLTGDLHTEFDNLLFKHRFEELEKKFKNSWTIVCERIRKVLPLVEENTRFKVEFEKYLEL